MIDWIIYFMFYVAFFLIGFGDGSERDDIMALGFLMSIGDLIIWFAINWNVEVGDMTVGMFFVVFIIQLFLVLLVEKFGYYIGVWYDRRRWE